MNCRPTRSYFLRRCLTSHPISNIQARTARLSWVPPVGLVARQANGMTVSCSYEVSLSDKGRDGKYRVIYSVSALYNALRGSSSETASFTTQCSVPDPPFPPKLSHRTKSTLTLQWKRAQWRSLFSPCGAVRCGAVRCGAVPLVAGDNNNNNNNNKNKNNAAAPGDNGSKITNYFVEWDEYGSQKHCKVVRLSPASGYAFRVAALNDVGTSGFSPDVVFYTMGTLPALPLPPRLVRAGVSWVALEWGRPDAGPTEEQIKYTLEIQEENSSRQAGTPLHALPDRGHAVRIHSHLG
ncbi:hypothetical protein CRUP_002116 [Coryphaenoides rupestris]|nr:hypothetical protein CRUP_002116 [Coryphaenoides rupestris]